MTRPLYWIVWVNGEPHRFAQRAAARGFAILRRAMGDAAIVKSVGF